MDSKKGIEDLRSYLTQFEATYPVKKGYVAQLLLDRCRPTISEVVKKVLNVVLATVTETDKYVHEKCLRNYIEGFNKMIRYKNNTLSKHWASLIELYQEPFLIPFRDSNAAKVNVTVPLQSCDNVNNDIFNESVSGTSPMSLRCSCSCESCANTKRTFGFMRSRRKGLLRKIVEIRKEHREKLAGHSLRRMKQDLKRKEATISKLKDKCKNLYVRERELVKARNALRLSRLEVKNLKSVVESLQKPLQKTEKSIDELSNQHLIYKSTVGPSS